MINLVSNAIKYNRQDGSGCVQISSHLTQDNKLRLCVTDNGPGIAQSDYERLFAPFERLTDSQNIEGTGIGLTLSKNLVEAMGGKIGVESEVGTGSTFWVEMTSSQPAALARAEKQDPVLAVRAYDHRHTVLYIEDTIANMRLIEGALQLRPSLRLIPAMLGQLGIDLARDHHPDLIILDLHLPDISGAEVLRRLKQSPKTRDIPVVILSADATKSQAPQLLKEGAMHYLTKPIDISTLIRLLDDQFAPDLVGAQHQKTDS